ncbi:MAG TPA: ABC transporter permease subunit [Candidatus Dormibacteraeota bacterium]|nr:ABC transporter permease subunit [Candidatus Dormibacteraeota bacterium]
MIASLRAENLKVRKRWANWILFAILLAWIILLVYLTFYLVIRLNPQSIQGPVPASLLKRRLFPENYVPSVLNTGESIGAAIMLIFGALSTASEYGWMTVQTILIQKPARAAVLLGKLLTIGITIVLVSLALFAVTALAAYVVATVDGSSSAWPSWDVTLKGFGALLLQLAVWTSLGAFLGIAFRSAAAAIGGGLVYLFVVEALLGGLLRNTPVVKEILKLLPGINGSAMDAAFTLTVRESGATAQLVSAGRGVVTLLIYLAVFTVLSLLIFQRRDVGGS